MTFTIATRLILTSAFISIVGTTLASASLDGQSTAADAVPLLMVGAKFDRMLPAEGSASYAVVMTAGQYLRLGLVERNMIAVVRVFDPNGLLLRTIHGRRYNGVKAFTFVALADGRHRVEVSAAPDSTPLPDSGFELMVNELASVEERLERSRQEALARTLTSPRLQALQKEARAGNRSAVEQFWSQMRTRGTPLVEPFVTTDASVRVTFLWRGGPETRNVLVAWPLPVSLSSPATAPAVEDSEMVQLPGTDVWYKTITFPRNTRIAYLFSINDPLRAPNFDELLSQRQATLHVDPLNPRRLDPDDSLAEWNGSLLELPGAPASWSERRTGVAAGTVEQRTHRSAILKSDREFTLYRPAGFQRGAQTCKLLLLMDGPSFQTSTPTPVILDNLHAAGRIPCTIAAFVTHTDRQVELYANPDFSDYLAKELVPLIRGETGAGPASGDVIVAGSSAGALGAAFTAWRHPATCGQVIAMSGSWHYLPGQAKNVAFEADWSIRDSWLASLFVRAPKRATRFYLSIGSFEEREPTRHLRDVLLAKGYVVEYAEFGGGHNHLNWSDALPAGLLALSPRSR